MQGACNVGIFMSAGVVGPKDEREAMKYFRLAAERQHAGACYMLGQFYEKEHDFVKAAAMYVDHTFDNFTTNISML